MIEDNSSMIESNRINITYLFKYKFFFNNFFVFFIRFSYFQQLYFFTNTPLINSHLFMQSTLNKILNCSFILSFIIDLQN